MQCPKCFNQLIKENNSYKCMNKHCYDISKEGYINLLLSKTNAGDNKDLIEGRINFLSKDFYYPLVNKIVEILNEKFNDSSFNLCDCGCGIGYYSKKINEANNNADLYGIDISKDAIKYAAKNDKKSLYVVASNQHIPFENNYFDVLLHIFSPIFEDEAYRIIKTNGILIVVTPGKEHLYELKQKLYSNPYYNKIEDQNYKFFTNKITTNLNYQISLNLSDFHNLIKMTPYYYKTKKEDIEKIKFEGSTSVTVDFIISIFLPHKK